MFDPSAIKKDFPIFLAHPDAVYLDSAATAQKPEAVLAAMDRFYRSDYGSVHRGVHTLSESATASYERARTAVAQFINAASSHEIVFTRGTTESINLVAQSWGSRLKHRDVVVLTEMEHHSNLIPWYMLAEKKELELRFIDVTDGVLDEADVEKQLKGAQLLAITYVSNVLGTINPLKELIGKAHGEGAKVLVDAAQSVPNMPVDVQDLDADWLAFSGHKAFGPTGIGVLYGKKEVLSKMPSWMGGGQMIREVGLGNYTPAEPPYRFEAGTMPVAEAIGLEAAVEYLGKLTPQAVFDHENQLTRYARERLSDIDGVTIYGPGDDDRRAGLISFSMVDVHAHDLASILCQDNVAIRSGHHCAQPLHEKLGVPATARASFSVFNTKSDVDALVTSLLKAKKVFA